MPTITDWLMLGITAIYVIATIFICFANIRSAKASQEQLSEMKHEYKENQRIGLMPYLSVRKCEETVALQGEGTCWISEPCTENYLKTTAILKLTNCGPGIAVDISYEWKNVEYSNRYNYVESLSAGDTRYLEVTIYARKPNKADGTALRRIFVDITLFDIFGNQYLQRICIYLEVSSESLVVRTNMPISKPELQKIERKEGKDA